MMRLPISKDPSKWDSSPMTPPPISPAQTLGGIATLRRDQQRLLVRPRKPTLSESEPWVQLGTSRDEQTRATTTFDKAVTPIMRPGLERLTDLASIPVAAPSQEM